MNAELNSPRVMAERVAYLLQVGLFLGGLLGCIGGIAQDREGLVACCCLALAAAAVLRHVGLRRWAFRDHERSWNEPVGPVDALGERLREVLALFARLDGEAMTPLERQDLRHRLRALLHDDEELVQLCQPQLARHPYLRH
jgi:hypothetical protein